MLILGSLIVLIVVPQSSNALSFYQNVTSFIKVNQNEPNFPVFNDPSLHETFHLYSSGLNIYRVWADGYTGRGVVVAVIDEGIETNHPELKDSLIKQFIPGSDIINDNFLSLSHGTACAGIIAAKPNNSFCSAGIAFNSKLVDFRSNDYTLFGEDRTFNSLASFVAQCCAEHTNWNYNTVINTSIDVFSMSIGPINDGKTLRPLSVTEESFLNDATLLGRDGKGIPFVVASGNGGVYLDHCSCDGLISSLYTIAVAGVQRSHRKPHYTEQCPSIMTSAFTGDGNSAGIVTAGTLGSCIDDFSGTSAAAPMVAAIIALGLEANPDLSYRQIQNLIVLSSRRTEQMHSGIVSNDFWWKNGAGRWASDLFGFGLLDAKRFVDGAKAMRNKTFPELHTCQIPFNVSRSLLINPQTETTFEVCTDAHKFTIPETITSLEHVRLRVDIQPVEDDPGFRGRLKIKLTSPYGRPIYMLNFRPLDKDIIFGFGNWTFNSVLHWFEDPQGCWSVHVTNSNSYGSFVLSEMTLELFGTNATKANYWI
ncbi:hypothetical protein ACOME3_003677 [Neoechinorhynchus agilis]